jgi:hypothetical protein
MGCKLCGNVLHFYKWCGQSYVTGVVQSLQVKNAAGGN